EGAAFVVVGPELGPALASGSPDGAAASLASSADGCSAALCPLAGPLATASSLSFAGGVPPPHAVSAVPATAAQVANAARDTRMDRPPRLGTTLSSNRSEIRDAAAFCASLGASVQNSRLDVEVECRDRVLDLIRHVLIEIHH